MGLFAPWHVESSYSRDRTLVSSIAKWILHHWAIREAPESLVFYY